MNVTSIIGGALLVVLGLLFIAVLYGLLVALPVMWLWNWLIPILFTTEAITKTITFWQALGLSLLCSFLFKSAASSHSKS